MLCLSASYYLINLCVFIVFYILAPTSAHPEARHPLANTCGPKRASYIALLIGASLITELLIPSQVLKGHLIIAFLLLQPPP